MTETNSKENTKNKKLKNKKYMKKIICVVIILICVSGFCFAENENQQSKKEIFGTYFTIPIEFTKIDPNGINNALSAAELPTLDNWMNNWGIASLTYLDGIILNFAFNYWGTNRYNDNTLEIDYNSFSVNIGYDLLHTVRYWLYPYAGYKNCEIRYKYGEKFDGTIEDYLTTNIRTKEIGNSRSHLDIGIGASTQLGQYGTNIQALSILINLRAGLLIPIQSSKLGGNNGLYELKETPKLNYKYYFIITFGWGNVGKETIKK